MRGLVKRGSDQKGLMFSANILVSFGRPVPFAGKALGSTQVQASDVRSSAWCCSYVRDLGGIRYCGRARALVDRSRFGCCSGRETSRASYNSGTQANLYRRASQNLGGSRASRRLRQEPPQSKGTPAPSTDRLRLAGNGIDNALCRRANRRQRPKTPRFLPSIGAYATS